MRERPRRPERRRVGSVTIVDRAAKNHVADETAQLRTTIFRTQQAQHPPSPTSQDTPTNQRRSSMPPPPMPPPPRPRLLPTRPFRPDPDPREVPRLKLDRNLNNARRMIPRPKLNPNRKRRRRERVWEVDVSVPGSVVVVGVGWGVGVEAGCWSCGAWALVGRVFGGGHFGIVVLRFEV